MYRLCNHYGSAFLSLQKLAIYTLPKLSAEQIRYELDKGCIVHINFSDTRHFNKTIQLFLSFNITRHEDSFQPYFDIRYN